MPRPRPVPLAWTNLTHDRVRFGLFALGIAFAVVLMGVQMGIRNALIDSNCRLIDHLNADLVLVHPYRASLFYREGVSRRRLEQAAAVSGVREVHPLYIDYQVANIAGTAPDAGEREPARTIRVYGVNPDADLLDLRELAPGAPGRDAIRPTGTALFDLRAKRSQVRPGESVFGPVPAAPTGPGWPVRTELDGRTLELVGGFDFGTDFAADGTLIMNDRTFLSLVRDPFYPFSPDAVADLGLVRVRPGEDPAAVRDRLKQAFGDAPDVDVFTVADFHAREKTFWLTMTPIGFAFGAGMLLGFVVGTVICYQILSGDVADHLAEYATLRAIGYPNRFLSRVVLEESLILAVAGFVPGIAVTAAVYAGLAWSTGLPVYFTPGRFLGVFAATVVMCVGSGLLALRKAQTVDPANVF